MFTIKCQRFRRRRVRYFNRVFRGIFNALRSPPVHLCYILRAMLEI